MIENTPQRRRYNLYYIYKDDYEGNLLSLEQIENARIKVFLKFFQKNKTESKPDSS